MAKIILKIVDVDEFSQYVTLGAFIHLDGEAFSKLDVKLFKLDEVTLDNEDAEQDLDLAEAFCSGWEITAGNEKMELVVAPEIDDLLYNLETEADENDVEEEKTFLKDVRIKMTPKKVKELLEDNFDDITHRGDTFTAKRFYIWGKEKTGEEEAKKLRDIIPMAKVTAFGNVVKERCFYVQFKFEE